MTGQTSTDSRAGKWLLPLIVVLVTVLALFAWDRYPALTSDLSGPVSVPARLAPSQVYIGLGNSIAILPFAGGEVVQDEAFWSTGFSVELHRLITRVPGLQVTSRSSSFYFKDQAVPLQVIAERLQSTLLLSGEFQNVDGRVRVVARLFDASKEKELWSQVFERDLGEVFAIQDEILAAVAKIKRLGLHGELPRSAPVNTQAWEFYLRGLYLREQRTLDGFLSAEQAFRSALELEPGYDTVRVALAGVWLQRSAAGDTDGLLVEKARDALATVLRSRPDMPEAHGLLSYIKRNYDWDWRGALEAAYEAIRLNPGDPDLMSTASLALFSLGQFDQAEELLDASVRQDPLNLARLLRLGLLQEFTGEYDQALSSYRQIIGLNSEFPGARAYRARIKIIQENPDSAERESKMETDPFWKRYAQILAYTAQERHDEAESLLQQMIEENGHHAAYQVTEILAFRGDIDAAFEWFQRAHDQRDGGMSEILGNYFLQNLHDDPRWDEMLILMGLPLDLNR